MPRTYYGNLLEVGTVNRMNRRVFVIINGLVPLLVKQIALSICVVYGVYNQWFQKQKDSICSSHLAVNGFYFCGFSGAAATPTTGYRYETSFIFFFVFYN
jgi:hypothetical protein